MQFTKIISHPTYFDWMLTLSVNQVYFRNDNNLYDGLLTIYGGNNARR